jgi:hypothetical protein
VIVKKILALSLFVFSLAALVRADVIPSFVAAVPDSQLGQTTWTYQVNVTAEQSLTSGDFFTIYDFGNIIPGSNVQPAGWTFSTSLLGVTPSQIIAADDPTIMNLTWTYNGPTILGTSPQGQGIGPFSVNIAGLSQQSRDSHFAAQGTLAIGPNAGSPVNNVGAIPVPIPEPSSVALLLSSGVAAIAFARFRRRKIQIG